MARKNDDRRLQWLIRLGYSMTISVLGTQPCKTRLNTSLRSMNCNTNSTTKCCIARQKTNGTRMKSCWRTCGSTRKRQESLATSAGLRTHFGPITDPWVATDETGETSDYTPPAVSHSPKGGDCSLTRKHKLIDRSENTLDNSSVEPRCIKAIGFHDSYSISTGCEIKAVHVSR